MHDASGVALGAEAKMEVQAFLDKFGVSEERPEAIGTFDFGGFPALLAALQDAHVLEARKSVLPRDQAWEALAEIGGKPVSDDAAARAAAAAAERAAASSKASPEKSRLKALVELGSLEGASVAQRAAAVKRLALAVDEPSEDDEDEAILPKKKKKKPSPIASPSRSR